MSWLLEKRQMHKHNKNLTSSFWGPFSMHPSNVIIKFVHQYLKEINVIQKYMALAIFRWDEYLMVQDEGCPRAEIVPIYRAKSLSYYKKLTAIF